MTTHRTTSLQSFYKKKFAHLWTLALMIASLFLIATPTQALFFINYFNVIPQDTNRLASTTYNLAYFPTNNIDDGYYVKVYFPSAVDISNVSSGDVHNSGSGMDTEYSKTIDPIAHTIEAQLHYPSGDSNYSELTMSIGNIINPQIGGTYPVTLEIYDASYTLQETLSNTFTITGPGIINPLVSLSDDTTGNPSTYTIDYTPTHAVDNNWVVQLDFPADTDLSGVSSGDVSFTNDFGSPYGTPTVTIDDVNKRISILIAIGSSQNADPKRITINNIVNTTPPGTKSLLITEISDKHLIIDSGTGLFTLNGIGSPVGLIDPVSITLSNNTVQTPSTYTISYTPPTNIEDHWNVVLTFPSEYDLSSLIPGSISMSGTNISAPHTTTIDNVAKTITMEASVAGSSNGDPITISIPNLTSPIAAGAFSIKIEDQTPALALVDQGMGMFSTLEILNSIPNAPSGLYLNTTALTAQIGRVDPLDLTSFGLVGSAIFSDPDLSNTATHYDIQVASDTSFSTLIYDSGKTPLITPLNQGERSEDLFIPSWVTPETTYYWRIKFWDNNDGQGAFSSGGAGAAKFKVLDGSAPYLNFASVSDGDTGIPVGTPLYFDFYDNETGVDPASLNMTMGGVNAVVNGVCESGFTCTINSDPNRVTIYLNKDPEMPGSAPLTVTYSMTDRGTTPNPFSGSVNFTTELIDNSAPVLTLANPVNGATNIGTSSNVTLLFTDNLSINATSLGITINGTDAITAGVCQAGFACTITPTATTLEAIINPDSDFSTSSPITVHYELSDASSNVLSDNLIFTTSAGIINTAPLAPTGLYANTQVNTSQIGATNPTNLTSTSVVVSSLFQDSDPLDTAMKYQLQVATDNTFTSIVHDSGALGSLLGTPVAVGNRSEDLIIPSSALSLETPYYWRVKFWDNNDNSGAFSTPASFMVADSITPSLTFSTPTNGATAVLVDSSFTLDLKDFETALSIPSLDVTLDGNEVVQNGICQAGYSCTLTPIANGQRLVFTPATALTAGASHTIAYTINDSALVPNTRTGSIVFSTQAAATPATTFGGSGGGYTIPMNSNSNSPLRNSANNNNNNNNNNSQVRQSNSNSSSTDTIRTSNTNSTPTSETRSRTITKVGKVAYEESICPSIESKTQMSSSSYSDLNDAQLAHYVDLLIKTGIAFDSEQGKLAPQSHVARSELVRFVIDGNCEDFALERVNTAPFPDVPATHKDAFYIHVAKMRHIISGYLSDGTYKPDNDITRAEALKIILEVTLGNGSFAFTGSSEAFSDIPWNDPLAWYRGYVQYAYEKGIIALPKDKQFRPHEKATREDIIYFFSQALQRKGN